MSTSISILKARLADADALSELARRTFHDTFASTNTPQNMQTYMDGVYSPEKQKAEIQDSRRSIYIAWDQTTPVAYLHLFDGEPESCVTTRPTLELLRIYVEKSHHGQGVAQSLMNFAIEIAREQGFKSLWLGVWENNHRAHKFYHKFGFQKIGWHPFVMGDETQTDDILELRL